MLTPRFKMACYINYFLFVGFFNITNFKSIIFHETG